MIKKIFLLASCLFLFISCSASNKELYFEDISTKYSDLNSDVLAQLPVGFRPINDQDRQDAFLIGFEKSGRENFNYDFTKGYNFIHPQEKIVVSIHSTSTESLEKIQDAFVKFTIYNVFSSVLKTDFAKFLKIPQHKIHLEHQIDAEKVFYSVRVESVLDLGVFGYIATYKRNEVKKDQGRFWIVAFWSPTEKTVVAKKATEDIFNTVILNFHRKEEGK